MVTVSGKTGSIYTMLIGCKVLQGRVSGGSICSDKGFSDPRFDTKSNANCDWSEVPLVYKIILFAGSSQRLQDNGSVIQGNLQ